MSVHHTTPFALCMAADSNPSQPQQQQQQQQQQQTIACLPLVMKDDHLHHAHHHHLHDYDRIPKIPITTNNKSAWTDAATECLIDVFEEKWISNRRGNLKARNWDEVGAELGIRCGIPKTGDQCRHKIEKLRGKFRQEKVISKFAHSKWPWFDRLNLVFGDRGGARQIKDPAAGAASDQFDPVGKASISSTPPVHDQMRESFIQHEESGNLASANQIQLQHHQLQHEQDQGLRLQVHDNIDKGGESFTSEKEEDSGSRDKDDHDEGSPTRSKNKGGSKRKRGECSDHDQQLGAAMKFLGEAFIKIEECRMENEKVRMELEMKRAQMQEVELKRTEMLVEMELKRTEMLCDLEVKRTKMQMELFESLMANTAAANHSSRNSKRTP